MKLFSLRRNDFLLLVLSVGLTACGEKFQTADIDVQTPTSSKPLDAEKQWQEQKHPPIPGSEETKPLLNPEQQSDFEKDILPEQSLTSPADESEKISTPIEKEVLNQTLPVPVVQVPPQPKLDVLVKKTATAPVKKPKSAVDTQPEVQATPIQPPRVFSNQNNKPPVTIDMSETLSLCQDSGNAGFTAANKKEFVCSLLPSAIRMNKHVYKQRIQVLALQEKAKRQNISEAESAWLSELKQQYRLEKSASYEQLLNRVDVIPLPLLIAQGAIESGWGSSRAAREGNNLFGIHGSLSKDSCLVAKGNSSICIRKYTSKIEGVSDYIQFLNTMRSTENFRLKRAAMRKSNRELDPFTLAQTLLKYSERGQAYVNQVCEMMRGQNFVRFVFKEEETV